MGNNNFTETFADGASLTQAKLETALQTLTLDISNTTQLATGTTSGTFLKSNGDGLALSFGTPSDPLGPFAIRNYGLSAAASVGALTVSLKSNAGTDPSSSDKVDIAFSTAGVSTATYSALNVAGALSITMTASATLGYTSTAANKVYVYAINVSNTPRLALSARSDLDNGQKVTTVAMSAAADSESTLYATAALSVVARLLGTVTAAYNSSGNWQSPSATTITNNLSLVSQASADAMGAAMGATGADAISIAGNKSSIAVATKSADYTITNIDKIGTLFVTTGSSDRTITLPSAVINVNRIIKIKKVDTGTGICSIGGTINGATNYSIPFKGETLTVQSNGTDYDIISSTPSDWADWTPTLTVTSPMTYTSQNILYARYQKHGKTIRFATRFLGTVGGSIGAGTIQFTLPISAKNLASSNANHSFSTIQDNNASGLRSVPCFVDSSNRSLATCNTSNGLSAGVFGFYVEGQYEVD